MNKPKFRAWDKNTQKMYQVSAIHIEDEYVLLFDKSIYEGEFTRKNEDIILMQYTGLKDKNGVEIFGKDAVEGFYGGTYVKGVIQFTDGCYCLQRIGDFPAICLFEVDNRNILGSIHANPAHFAQVCAMEEESQ